MRIQDFREDDTPEINLIPLIDVLLCLLIFFVVTTTFDARSVLKLQLPRADGQPADARAQPLGILINAQGRYFVGDRELLRTDVESLKQALRAAKQPATIALLIGPEGGMEESEVTQLVKAGAKSVSLGPRILRTETAGMAMLAQTLYEVES